MQVWLPDEIWLSDSSETERIYVWPFVLYLFEPNTAMFGKLMLHLSLLNSGSSALPGLEWKLLHGAATCAN